MKPPKLALCILFFDYVRSKSQKLFTWEEVKAVSKGVIISQDLINYDQQIRSYQLIKLWREKIISEDQQIRSDDQVIQKLFSRSKFQ